ncbi:PPK2 family polyphosphate kinase [Levilactobacillus bambusae]|uniref:Phosphate--nucleotide phosphotransferase n=1 Tax=Levilactobacillus bambusae TaxID=2024736 RepID=A0A2V1N4F2_9LACO|nr:PPK2 family polyphosphate kinase [Levilactobacillus bambusae]PWG00710.1 phosphate--nucleotide phosphotransferase [Levilactobacillus bambusae]
MGDEELYRYTGNEPVNINKIPTRAKPAKKVSKQSEKVTEQAKLDENVQKLADFQQRLYADKQTGIIILLQGMDASGKDGMIRHVFSGMNPEGTSVANFKQPTSVELSHDYLWRVNNELPARGEIKIFNRSQYEEVLVDKVHPNLVLNEKIPGITSSKDVTQKLFDTRYRDLKAYERYLRHQGFVFYKFFLHLSKDEQDKRFIKRITTPEKNWKFSASDAKERAYWDDYQMAYNKMLRGTATKKSPWYIIPADDKVTARLIVSNILVQHFEAMKLTYPTVSNQDLEAMKKLLPGLKEQLGR